MKKILLNLVFINLTCFAASCQNNNPAPKTPTMNNDSIDWKKKLTPEQYAITCEGSTEPPFTGKYLNNHAEGEYKCIRCGNTLFTSDTKFDSGSGWPSFYNTASDTSVASKRDVSYGMIRTEVVCKKCGAHLGHVFDDGPKPTGLRYCINSGALDFEKK